MPKNNNQTMSNEDALRWVAKAAIGLSLLLVVVEIPVALWGLLNARPRLLHPVDVFVGIYELSGQAQDERPFNAAVAFGVQAGVFPPLWVAIVLNLLVVSGIALLWTGGWLHVDRWRSRSQLGAGSLSPRRKVRSRVWAKPRDVLHLQPRVGSRSGVIRRACNRVLRVVLWERTAPAPIGGDSWNLGRLRGAELRSDREMHAVGFGTSGAGKSMCLLAPQVREHDGPLVVLLNKTDVLLHTVAARERKGPVWVFAPMTDLGLLGLRGCDWSPLPACRQWDQALLTGSALLDADPRASTATGSDGAQFYNADAVQALLPPLLHAAALGELAMGDVLRWTRGGVNGLDEPRELLEEHDAWTAARLLAGVQEVDHRQRSLLMTSAAHLVAAYRHPAVQQFDRAGLDVKQLVEQGGTLYLIAPESMQDELAPLFGAILGELLRYCERRAHRTRDTRTLPLVKIVADEAAHLAPLGKLPTYLAVARGWRVAIMVAYQSIAQIRARYGVEADTILANTGVKVFLGPIHDRVTREELVAFIGEEPVTRTSHTSRSFGSDHSTTHAEEQRPKLSADDLARLAKGEAVLIHGRDVPAVIKLPFWWKWVRGARTPEDAINREEGELR